MKKILTLILAGWLFPGFAADTEIKIADTKFSIPAPAGFAAVSAEMEAMNKLFDAMVNAPNLRLAEFIPEQDISAARNGELVELGRYFGVQTIAKNAERIVTKGQFAALASLIQKQNQELMNRVEKQTPGAVAKLNQNLAKAFEGEPTLKSIKMIPFPPHDQSDRSLAFSMMINYGSDDGSGGTNSSLTAATATLLHLKGKLVFLYCFGEETDLTWTKTVSKDWAAAVLKANPSDPQTARLESGSGRAGLNWTGMGRKVLIGSAIGGAIALLGFFLQRRDAASAA